MLKALIELGMTPSSRSRVKVSEPQREKNKKERFFK
jgi:phage terminase small subunit